MKLVPIGNTRSGMSQQGISFHIPIFQIDELRQSDLFVVNQRVKSALPSSTFYSLVNSSPFFTCSLLIKRETKKVTLPVCSTEIFTFHLKGTCCLTDWVPVSNASQIPKPAQGFFTSHWTHLLPLFSGLAACSWMLQRFDILSSFVFPELNPNLCYYRLLGFLTLQMQVSIIN